MTEPSEYEGKAEVELVVYNASRMPLDDVFRAEILRARDGKMSRYLTPLRGRVNVVGLEPGVVYIARVLPSKYRPVSKFFRAQEAGSVVTFHCPVKPECVEKIIVAPSAGERIEPLLQKGTFAEHHHLRKAGLLNIWAKMQATEVYRTDAPVSDFVISIQNVQRDRIYFIAKTELLERVRRAAADDQLVDVAGTLHDPPPGTRRVGSYKTPDRYGNLQLTFFDGDELIVEADIDDASGLGHVFQVLRNAFRGASTHPYDIHEILTFHQELDTGYSLVV